MFNSKSVKYVALSGFMGLFATMLGALGDIPNQAFAQITPASEKYGGSSSDQSSSSAPPSSDDESGGGSNPDSSGSSSLNDDNAGQDSETSDEEEGTIEDESMDSDSDEKNPLLEQIIDQVKQDFAAAGMSSLDW
jgi:hypothetical protein